MPASTLIHFNSSSRLLFSNSATIVFSLSNMFTNESLSEFPQTILLSCWLFWKILFGGVSALMVNFFYLGFTNSVIRWRFLGNLCFGWFSDDDFFFMKVNTDWTTYFHVTSNTNIYISNFKIFPKHYFPFPSKLSCFG